MPYQLIETHQCFGGTQSVYGHWSETTNSEMRFAVFFPSVNKTVKIPALYWLSGLTCSEQNFITKAGAQRIAAQLNIALIVPDTSPRHIKTLNNEDSLGEGASFYVDAIQAPWQAHYQMYTYISQELPNFIAQYFPIDPNCCGISGHSMGGHGALIIGLRNPEKFRSISAFSPISSAVNAPWGINALSHYLGENKEHWQNYDACFLLKNSQWPYGKILVDQGSADPFLETQLKPQLLIEAAQVSGIALNLRIQPNYDHSYYFVSSFIEEHLRFHKKELE